MIERLAEEERLRAEEEAALAAAAEAKHKEEAEAAARRETRERERQEALEKARLQQQREDEALARREARAAEKLAATRKPLAAPTAVPASVRAAAAVGKEDNLWRRSTPVPSHPATATAPPAPLRSESPAPKYRPGAISAAAGGGGGGWRQREEAAKAAAAGGAGGRPGPIPPRVTASPRPNSPAPLKDEPKDEDGFQTVPTRGGGGAGDRGGVWRPTRGGRA